MAKDKKAQEIIEQANEQMAEKHQHVTIETFDGREDIYLNFKGFNLGQNWVMVTDVEGNTTIYPADNITRITQRYE